MMMFYTEFVQYDYSFMVLLENFETCTFESVVLFKISELME